jgi:2-polyprenyl-3-methyl-5-hydroxy-6-metoxy-1,4-benzoquinol methylase
MSTNGSDPLDIKIRERSGRRPDRYPTMFKKTVEIWRSPYILSFGCSYGEECHSLRKYHPYSTILGVDINKKVIKIAQQENKDPKIYFAESNQKLLQTMGPYDLIFALNVLRMNHKNRSTLYPFVLFNKQITALSKLIKPMGGLVISGYQYNFEKTDVYSSYRLIYQDDKRLARIYRKNG